MRREQGLEATVSFLTGNQKNQTHQDTHGNDIRDVPDKCVSARRKNCAGENEMCPELGGVVEERVEDKYKASKYDSFRPLRPRKSWFT